MVGKIILIGSDTANRLKLCGNCAFSQNFRARKLGEITVFFVVWILLLWEKKKNSFFTFKYLKLNLLFVSFYCLVNLHRHCSYKFCSSKYHCLRSCEKSWSKANTSGIALLSSLAWLRISVYIKARTNFLFIFN